MNEHKFIYGLANEYKFYPLTVSPFVLARLDKTVPPFPALETFTYLYATTYTLILVVHTFNK